jgi:hypothetical protein
MLGNGFWGSGLSGFIGFGALIDSAAGEIEWTKL